MADLAAQDFEGEWRCSSPTAARRTARWSGSRAPRRPPGSRSRVLENPERLGLARAQPCIGAARGELIVRMDCHSRYPSDYLRRCAAAAPGTGAWNVGGGARAQRHHAHRARRGVRDGQPVRRHRLDARGSRRRARRGRHGDVRRLPPGGVQRVGLFDETLRAQPGRRAQPAHPPGRRARRARPGDPGAVHAAREPARRLPPVLRVRPLEGAGDAQAPAGAEPAQPRAAGLRRRHRAARRRRPVLGERPLAARRRARGSTWPARWCSAPPRSAAAGSPSGCCRACSPTYPAFHVAYGVGMAVGFVRGAR